MPRSKSTYRIEPSRPLKVDSKTMIVTQQKEGDHR